MGPKNTMNISFFTGVLAFAEPLLIYISIYQNLKQLGYVKFNCKTCITKECHLIVLRRKSPDVVVGNSDVINSKI